MNKGGSISIVQYLQTQTFQILNKYNFLPPKKDYTYNDIVTTLLEKGYYISISSQETQRGKYITNCELYKIPPSTSFKISPFSDDIIPPSRESATIYQLSELDTLIPNILEKADIMGAGRQGLILGENRRLEDEQLFIFIFTDNIRKESEQQGVDYNSLKKHTILNEVASFYLSLFTSQNFDNTPISQFGVTIEGLNINIYGKHINEAYSDYFSIKHSDQKLIPYEIERILIADIDQYALTRSIVFMGVTQGLKDIKSIKRVNQKNIVEIVRQLSDIEIMAIRTATLRLYKSILTPVLQKVIEQTTTRK